MVREISSKKIHSSFSHVRYQGRVMLIENTASLWGTTIRWYNLHKIVVVWVNQSYYYAFILYTLLKNYIIYHQWSCLPLSLYLLFQGLHTDEWPLWEGERICFPFSFWRWLSPVPNGAGTVLMSFRSWNFFFFFFWQVPIEPQLFQFPTKLAVLAFPCNQFGHQENAINQVLIDQTDYQIFFNCEYIS